jgi:hypothetical protein
MSWNKRNNRVGYFKIFFKLQKYELKIKQKEKQGSLFKKKSHGRA